jgi:hypothetical protein
MVPPAGEHCELTAPFCTLQEDAALAALVTKMGRKNWQKLAQHIPGRCAKSCRLRCADLATFLQDTQLTNVLVGGATSWTRN